MLLDWAIDGAAGVGMDKEGGIMKPDVSQACATCGGLLQPAMYGRRALASTTALLAQTSRTADNMNYRCRH